MKKSFGTFEEVKSEVDFDYETLNSRQSLGLAVEILGNSPYFAFDIETTGLDPLEQEAEVLSIAFAAPDFLGGMVFGSEEDAIDKKIGIEYLIEILALPTSKIAHNGKFDVCYLEKVEDIETKNFIYDTLLGFYLLDENPRKRGLKPLTREFTALGILEFPGEKSLKEVQPKKILKYNCSDARATLALFEIAKTSLEKLKMIELWKLITKASVVLGQMEINGVKINLEKLKKMETKTQKEELALREGLMKIAKLKEFPELNLNSPLSLRQFLIDILGLKISDLTKKGAASTNKAALEKLDHPFPKGLLLWRRKKKLLKTYFENLREAIANDGRIHPDYRLWGTRSGRTSCSKPNLQNIPRDGEIRSSFIPEENNFLIEGDFAQCELRTMALYSKDKNLSLAFASGRDPHREVAAFLFRKDLLEITDEERRKAKSLNFALLYGMGPASLSEELAISKVEADKLIQRYYALFPQIQKWIENQYKKALKDGEVTSILNRKRRFPELKRGYALNSQERDEIRKQSVNTVIQGTASDFVLMGLIRVSKKIEGMKSKLVLFVHDSIVVESPKEEVKEIIKILRIEMPHFSRNLPIPFEVEIKIGLDWKNMEKVGGKK